MSDTIPTCENTCGENVQKVKTQVERNYEWRKKNPEKWLKYQRELMRKRRANGS